MSAPGSAAWLAAHEFRLSWREWISMMTANRRRRIPAVLITLLVFFVLLHLPAYLMVGGFASPGKVADKMTLLTVTIALALYVSLMLSQAMESVTRAFYSRADLDLILSSPTSSRRVFAVRIAAIAFSIATMAVLLGGPFINIMILDGGPYWLSGYAVAAALGAGSTGLAVAITVGLFRLLGPRRTRFVAQVVAAVIGAACVIGIQTMAILSYGTLARPGSLISGPMLAMAPPVDSAVWLPARAVMGDLAAAAAVVLTGIVLLGLAILVFSGRFGEHALAAASAPPKVRQRSGLRPFRRRSPASVLRHKEWMLLRRDPWLASQTLTQLLYLLPPALLLSRNFGDVAGSSTMVVLVLVTVAGQLAGGLAWLAISGEDAPELVATAPVTARAARRAKVEAVLGAAAMIFAPLLAVLALASPQAALVAAGGIALATLSSIRIQLWFRSQARRAHFRRRHTSSRVATFAEAFSSFAWAGAAGLAAGGLWHAALAAVFALLILGGAWLVSPRKASP
ncbi:MAG: permease [Rhizobiales bacterium]|nr:permease [Hyphomicrobiales bacterium]